MCKNIQEDPTVHTERGNLLHSRVDPVKDILDLKDEDQNYAIQSRQYLKKIVSEQPTKIVHLEITLFLNDEKGEELTFGTIDAIVEQEDRTVLIDWKFGRSEVEKAGLNDQLQIYSGMVLQHIVEDKNNPVSCRIYQPFLKNPESEWTYSDLDSIVELYSNGIRECEKPEIKLVPTQSNCKYCPANNGSCPGANELSTAIEKIDIDKIELLPAQQFVALYRMLPIVSERIKKINKEAFNRALRNELPGYSIEEKPGNRYLTDPQGVFNALKNYEDLISLGDFLQDHIKMGGTGNLKKIWVEKYTKLNPKVKKTEAEKLFYEILDPYFSRKADIKKIVED